MLDLFEHRFFADDSSGDNPDENVGEIEDTGTDEQMNPDEPTA